MQGNARITALFVVVALAVAGGLVLLGVFDSETADRGADGTGRIENEASAPSGGDRGHPKGGAGIKTKRFSDDDETQSARVEERATGLSLQGEVRSPGDQLLADARVVLIRDVSQIRARFQEGDVVAETTTKKSGRFSFEDLAPGEVYILKVTHDDFTTERVHPIDSSIATTLRQVVRLGNGVTIAGGVNDAGGAPIVGARVEVFDISIGTVNVHPEPEQVSETGPGGRFEVSHLRRGVKKVLVHKAGYASDGRSALDLRHEEELDQLAFVLSRGSLITGVVRDRQSGEPVAGAQITARPFSYLARQVTQRPNAGSPDEVRGNPGIGGSTAPRPPHVARPGRPAIASKSFLVANAITDAGGRFELHGVLEARYTLRIFARGFNRTHGRTVDAGSPEVEILLSRSPRIIGHVVDAATGAPVTRFTMASSPQPNPLYMPPHTTQRYTGRTDGSFEYLDARVGKNHLIAQAEGYAGGRSEPVLVQAGADATGIVVKMVRGAEVTGFVLATDGAPVSGAELSLQPGRDNNLPSNPFSEALKRQIKPRGSHRAMTDKSGRFHFKNVLGGNYRVHGNHEDYAPLESSDVTVPDEGTVETGPYTMARGGVIEGIVKTAAGRPDPRAQITVTPVGGTGMPSGRSAATDSQGLYRVKGLPPGTYRVLAAQREGTFRLDILLDPANSGARMVTITDGETIRVDF